MKLTLKSTNLVLACLRGPGLSAEQCSWLRLVNKRSRTCRILAKNRRPFLSCGYSVGMNSKIHSFICSDPVILLRVTVELERGGNPPWAMHAHLHASGEHVVSVFLVGGKKPEDPQETPSGLGRTSVVLHRQ